MDTTHYVPDDLKLGPGEFRDETLYLSLEGTAGSVTDTTSYPVAAQATKTEKVTIDGGTEQTVTFTTAISRGHAVTSNTFPVGSQDTKTEKVTIDGGFEQTVTFAGAITDADDIAAQMDAQLTGCKVVVEGGAIHIYSDSKGPSSSVAIGTGTTDLTWATPAAVNTAEDVAIQMNGQLTGCDVNVVSGQVKITSDNLLSGSSVAIGTGTTDLTWATAVAGTAKSGTVAKGTLLARNSSTKVLNVYNASGSNATDEPVAVLPYEIIFTATGSKAARAQFAGKVAQEQLSEHDNSSALDTLVIDKLIKNSGIVPVSVRALSSYDNE